MAPSGLMTRHDDSLTSNTGDARSLAVLKLVDDVDEVMRAHRGALDRAIEECLLGVLIHDDEATKPMPPPRTSLNASNSLDADCVIEEFVKDMGEETPATDRQSSIVLEAKPIDTAPNPLLQVKSKWSGLGGASVVPISSGSTPAGIVAAPKEKSTEKIGENKDPVKSAPRTVWQEPKEKSGEKDPVESAAAPPSLPAGPVPQASSDPALPFGIVPAQAATGPETAAPKRKSFVGAFKKAAAAEKAEQKAAAGEASAASDGAPAAPSGLAALASGGDKTTSFASMVKVAQAKNTVEKAAKAKKRRSKNEGFASEARKQELLASQNIFQRMTASRYWEVGSVILILANSLFIGILCQFMSTRAENDVAQGREIDNEEPGAFLAFEIFFSILFFGDLVIRWLSEGLIGFWRTDDVLWNLLDLVIVVFGTVDIVFTLVADHIEIVNLSFVRVFRVVRVVRVARIIRVLKFFRELRMMVMSILASFKSLMWVIIILTMLFYVFGIIFTNGLLSDLNTVDKRRENPELVEYYGNLLRSVLTLYMAMSGGNDWGEFYGCLSSLSGAYSFLFICYITFAILAVFNIVTGVFVESAMGASQEDRDARVQDEIAAQKSHLKAMEKLFEELDDDDSGTLTLDEFQSRLSDPRVEAYFNSLKLDVSDAKIIFNLLDEDQSGEITCGEFVDGCGRLQGEARSLDTKIMQQEVRSVRRAVDKLTKDFEVMQQK